MSSIDAPRAKNTPASASPAQTDDTPWLDPNAKPFIQIQGVTKQFGPFTAVDDVSLDIYQGELFTLLGGSGCGKTTLLRMLAGFETPTQGRILLDGVDMTDLPPYERPVNMMFQSYALFPHMTVAKNIAYGLKHEKLTKPEIEARVTEMLELVQLGDFGLRKPHQLSGGQRQRVALARALIKRPKLLLLDEPLAALDKKLREQTQFELMNIQEQVGVTFIVVTHDQEEAMTLSSRMAVMNQGEIAQIGTPEQVYETPSTRLTADFIGTINIFEGRVTDSGDAHITLDSAEAGAVLQGHNGLGLQQGSIAWLAVRPEKIDVSKSAPQPAADNCVTGIVHDIGYYGTHTLFRIKLDSGKLIQITQANRQRGGTSGSGEPGKIDWDDRVYLTWEASAVITLTE